MPRAGRKLRSRVGFARDAPGARRAAAAREIGQALQRVRRIAKMAEQRCKGAWARYYGANATRLIRTKHGAVFRILND